MSGYGTAATRNGHTVMHARGTTMNDADFWNGPVTFDGETVSRRRAALRREAAGVPVAETLAAFLAGAATFADGAWAASTYERSGPNGKKGDPCERNSVTGKSRPVGGGKGGGTATADQGATASPATAAPAAPAAAGASAPVGTPAGIKDVFDRSISLTPAEVDAARASIAGMGKSDLVQTAKGVGLVAPGKNAAELRSMIIDRIVARRGAYIRAGLGGLDGRNPVTEARKAAEARAKDKATQAAAKAPPAVDRSKYPTTPSPFDASGKSSRESRDACEAKAAARTADAKAGRANDLTSRPKGGRSASPASAALVPLSYRVGDGDATARAAASKRLAEQMTHDAALASGKPLPEKVAAPIRRNLMESAYYLTDTRMEAKPPGPRGHFGPGELFAEMKRRDPTLRVDDFKKEFARAAASGAMLVRYDDPAKASDLSKTVVTEKTGAAVAVVMPDRTGVDPKVLEDEKRRTTAKRAAEVAGKLKPEPSGSGTSGGSSGSGGHGDDFDMTNFVQGWLLSEVISGLAK